MKRLLAILMSLVTVVTVCFALPFNTTAADGVTTVDVNTQYQTMRGFGASGAWWAKEIGNWSNIDEISKLLYDDKEGIGLNIYRYNLGAGSDRDTIQYRSNRAMECFANEDGTYDWTRDANQQLALASVKKFGGDDLRITLFSNSAPIFMTKNGHCIPDTYWWGSNLDRSKYPDYAKYCIDCANYFIDQGYRITDVSPVNEPYGHWCREYTEDANGNRDYTGWAGQEADFYEASELRELFNVFIHAFTDKNTGVHDPNCKVSLFEANSMVYDENAGGELDLSNYLKVLFGTDLKYSRENKDIRNYCDTISIHSYYSKRDEKKVVAEDWAKNYKKYNVAQTEYCQMNIDDSNYDLNRLYYSFGMSSGLTMNYALVMSNVIFDDLTIMNACEWDWWSAVGFGGYTDGLVYVNKDDHSVYTSKRLWSLGNFSKFTDEGSVRVGSQINASGVNTVAFKNPDGTLSVVFINNNETPVTTALNVNGMDISGKCCNLYVTDESRDLVKCSTAINDITLPAGSVSTLVITNDQHVYSYSGAVSPNCTSQGYTAYTCLSCGNVYKADFVKENGHNFGNNNAVCLTCGAANPNYVAPSKTNSSSGSTAAAPASPSSSSSSSSSGKTVTVPKITLSSVKSKKKKQLTVTWKKNTKVTGYEVQYSTSSKFTKKTTKSATIKKNKTTSKTISKLKSKKKYYVRIRAYKTVKGKKVYSKWSAVKKATVK